MRLEDDLWKNENFWTAWGEVRWRAEKTDL